MQAAEKKTIYLFSGLGADERAFHRLNFSGHPLKYIKWVLPKKNEAMEDYAARLAQQITDPNAILIGLSFGGMIAIEVAKLIPTSKIILIASAKTRSEIPLFYRRIGSLGLLKIIPAQLLKSPNTLTNWLFGAKSNKDKLLLKQILRETDNIFLKWALTKITRWQNSKIAKNTIHIHGTSDHILRYVKNCIWIKHGGHLITLNRAKELSDILQKILKDDRT